MTLQNSVPTAKLPSLTAFFPCYNEEENVELMIKTFLQILPQLAEKYEVLIINDGSTDRTAQKIDHLKKKYSHVSTVHHSRNLGYGASLRSGFKAAKYEWTFFTDGDMQFDVSQLAEFIQYTDKYDVIIGYRRRRAEGGMRALNAKLFKLYIDFLFRLHVKDIDCAFKLMRSKVIKELPLQSTGAFTSAEFLYRLKKAGYTFKQLPVDHFARQFGKPTGNNPKVVVKAALEAFRLYLHMKLDRVQGPPVSARTS